MKTAILIDDDGDEIPVAPRLFDEIVNGVARPQFQPPKRDYSKTVWPKHRRYRHTDARRFVSALSRPITTNELRRIFPMPYKSAFRILNAHQKLKRQRI